MVQDLEKEADDQGQVAPNKIHNNGKPGPVQTAGLRREERSRMFPDHRPRASLAMPAARRMICPRHYSFNYNSHQ